jgi:geranylgeranyl reductase family protein
MSMIHDAVVVGAGPAGATAAAVLARGGRSVLFLDREKFPRDKACGDGIPPGTVGILNDLGLREELRAAAFYSIRSLQLVSARGREWRLNFEPRRDDADFFIAPRIHFDDLLRRHAIASGAVFQRARVRASLVEDGRVVGVRAEVGGEKRDIRARVVIGADGATSAVARSLARPRPPEKHRAVAIRAYLENFETLPRTVEFHFGARYAPGYAWVFPLGESSANVGVIVRTDRFKRRGVTIDDLLREFVEDNALRRRGAASAALRDTATWQLPLAAPARVARAFDGAVLAGDAAGLVDALTGEGIHAAVVSGMLAAQVVDRALDSGDVSRASLVEYERLLDRELGRYIRRSYRCQKYITAFPPALEAMFVLAGACRPRVTRWLDRVSTDFRVAER